MHLEHRDEIKPRGPYGQIGKLVDEFRNSQSTCMEIMDYKHASAKGCANSFYWYLKKHRMNNLIKVIQRQDQVFLVKVKI